MGWKYGGNKQVDVYLYQYNDTPNHSKLRGIQIKIKRKDHPHTAHRPYRSICMKKSILLKRFGIPVHNRIE